MNERLTLQLDVQTVGEAQVNKLADALNKVVSISEKAGKSTGAAFSALPQQLQQFVQNPAAAAESALGGLTSGFGPAGIAAGVMVTALSTFGLASMAATRALADLGDRTDDLALQLGLTTKEVGQFDFAAKSTGDTIDIFVGAMRKLSDGLANGGEEGKKASQALESLGVKTRTLSGDIRPMGEIFQQIATGLNAVGDTAHRNALAVEIFGRAGITLLPTLSTLNDRLSFARNHDIGIDEATTKRYVDLKTRIVEVDTAWETAKRHFSDGIAGTIWLNIKGAGAALLNGLSGDQSNPKTIMPGAHSGTSGRGVLSYFLQQDISGPAENGSINRDRLRFGSTLAGAQSNLEDLKSKEAKARNDYLGSAGQASQEAADRLKKTWTEAETALKRQEETVKLLSKAESEHMAVLEQAAKLRKEGTPFYNLGGGAIVQQGQPMRLPPTLRRSGESGENFGVMGTFVSPESDRNALAWRGDDGAFNGAAQEFDRNAQIKRDGLRNELDYRTRILELTAGPGGELQAAMKANELRLSAAERDFEITNDLVRLEDERTRIAYDGAVRVAEYRARELQQARNFGAGLFNAGINGGIGGFIKGQIQGVGSTVAGNGFGELFKSFSGLIPHASGTLGNLLKSTPFGPDPLKASASALDLSALKLSAAGDKLLGVSGGTAGVGAALSGIPGIAGGSSGSLYQYGAIGEDGLPTRGLSNSGLNASLPGSSGRLGALAKYGTAAVAAGGGAFAAYQGFSRGGLSGALEGTAGIAAVAAGVLPLLSKSLAMAGPIGAAVGIGLSLVTGLLGDPKKKRENQITKELNESVFHAPTALNATLDGSGNYTDFDARGNLRRSSFSGIPQTRDPYTRWGPGNTPYEAPGSQTSPYTIVNNYTINAIDTQSFSDALMRNKDSVGNATASHLADNDAGMLGSALRFAVSG